MPLRDRNTLLLAGGYAPAYPERGLAQPDLKAVRDALKRVLAGHEPYPAVVVNRWWELAADTDAIAAEGARLLDFAELAGTGQDVRFAPVS